jgi:hypothetical protein
LNNNQRKKRTKILPLLLSFDDIPLGEVGEFNGFSLVGVVLKKRDKIFEIIVQRWNPY